MGHVFSQERMIFLLVHAIILKKFLFLFQIFSWNKPALFVSVAKLKLRHGRNTTVNICKKDFVILRLPPVGTYKYIYIFFCPSILKEGNFRFEHENECEIYNSTSTTFKF